MKVQGLFKSVKKLESSTVKMFIAELSNYELSNV